MCSALCDKVIMDYICAVTLILIRGWKLEKCCPLTVVSIVATQMYSAMD